MHLQDSTVQDSGQRALPFVGVSGSATVPPSPAAEQLAGARGRCDARQGASGKPGLVISRISDRTHIEVAVYRADVVVKRRQPWPEGVSRPGGGKRGRVVGFSRSSRQRFLHEARNLQGMETLLTLTYPGEFPCDGATVKKHLAAMRKWLVRRDLAGMWVLEFQKRGAPHFHLFLNGRVPKALVSAAWFRIVGSGDPRHLVAGTKVEKIRHEHAVGAYAAKYAGKSAQKDVPKEYANVGRFWGFFGGLKAEPVEVIDGPLEQEFTEDPETGELVEETPPMAQLVRWVKRVYEGQRARKGLRPPRRDNGLYSFRCWDVGPPVRVLLQQMGFVLEVA